MFSVDGELAVNFYYNKDEWFPPIRPFIQRARLLEYQSHNKRLSALPSSSSFIVLVPQKTTYTKNTKLRKSL